MKPAVQTVYIAEWKLQTALFQGQSLGKYIHLPKYLWCFLEQIYAEIFSRLYSPLEYIWTFIWIVRFQWIYSNIFIKQNKTCYSKSLKQFDLSLIKFTRLCNSNQSILCIQIYLYINLWVHYMYKYIWTFIYEKLWPLNIFGHAFVSNFH